MEKDEQGRESWMRRLADRVAYAWTFARLGVYDRIAGSLPATEADVIREGAKERLRRAFPDVDIDGEEAANSVRRKRSGHSG